MISSRPNLFEFLIYRACFSATFIYVFRDISSVWKTFFSFAFSLMNSCFDATHYSDGSSLSCLFSYSGVIVENYFVELLLIRPIIFEQLVDYCRTCSTLLDSLRSFSLLSIPLRYVLYAFFDIKLVSSFCIRLNEPWEKFLWRLLSLCWLMFLDLDS